MLVNALPYGLPSPPKAWVQRRAGVSLCMIVKNEERFLDACLASVGGIVDEVNIVDTGSTDRTLEIATRRGARIERHVWNEDFSAARNRALDMATYRWVLVLDADETLDASGAAAVKALGPVPAYLSGLWIRCRNLVDDYKGSEAMSNAIVRIFPNHERLRYRNAIHEFIALDGDDGGAPAVMSDITIEHRGYLSEIVAERKKTARNLTLSRRAVERDPADAFHWYNYGAAAHLAGDIPAAIDALERMRALTTGIPRAFRPQGLTLLATLYSDARQDHRRALELARETLCDAPHFAAAHFIAGKAYARLGRFGDARAAYEAAVEAGTRAAEQFVVDDEISQWKAQSEIAATLMYEGRHAEALGWLERGLRNRPDAQPLVLNRAKALEALQRYAEADEAFASAYRTFPDGLSATEYVNFLLRRGEFERAFATIDRAAGTVRGSAGLLLGSGIVLALAGGDEPRALAYLERALDMGLEPADLQTLFADLGAPAAAQFLQRHVATRVTTLDGGLTAGLVEPRLHDRLTSP